MSPQQGNVETKRESNEVYTMEPTITTETIATGNMPEKKFSTGTISATVWQNHGKSKEGEDVSYRSVSLQRRYMDKDGQWKSTQSLRVNDVPKAALVLQKAYEFIVMKDGNLPN